MALQDNLNLRFGAGKTITRPDFAALNPSTIYFSPGATLLNGTGTGGNPKLENTTFTNLDPSLERYFTDASLLSLATFFRDFDGFIITFAQEETFNGQTYIVSRPANNESGAQPGSSIINEPSESLDLSMSYSLNDALTFTFDVTNLTEDVFKNYFGGDSSADSFLYPRDTIIRDRTFSLGVRFKY